MTIINEALLFEGKVPLQVNVQDSLPHEYEAFQVNRSNENLMKSCLLISDPHEHHDEHSELAQAFIRQEMKLNLIFELLNELISSTQQLPPMCNIRLSTEELHFDQDSTETSSLEPGKVVEVLLYFMNEIPKPLRFFGTVSQCENGNCTIEFSGISQSVADLLEKLIFRYHRRKIAQDKAV